MLKIGNQTLRNSSRPVSGEFISIDGERYYIISNFDSMQPFFISLANDSDLWMYVSSTGGLTAGRQSPDKALFPYYTDDKVTDQFDQTGPKTIVRATINGTTYLWMPFSNQYKGIYNIERQIAKSTIGNKLLFIEYNHDLKLSFSYQWCGASAFGWIRTAEIQNLSETEVEIDIVDGLQNILPSGVNRQTQNVYSTLVDAYKRTEIVPNTSLALFRMEAIMVDKAEPAESLRCNTVFSVGLENPIYLTSSRQLSDFANGQDLKPELENKGMRGAYFINAQFVLDPQTDRTWYQVLDVDNDALDVNQTLEFLKGDDVEEELKQAMKDASDAIFDIVKNNDGLQFTGDEHNDARHFANTLFNTMRGGYYLDNYEINVHAFADHVRHFNRAVYERHEAFFNHFHELVPIAKDAKLFPSDNRLWSQLREEVERQNDPQLTRLFYEYLPITFGRRHGDPSRPWNSFNIRVKDENGEPIVSYQGNWRDIFQNWEALSLSYPNFINSIISKFLNATTVDGYNPYRITSEGIDWEVINPEDPWSNIGYWGDHQIIYLTRLLEWSGKFDFPALRSLVNKRQFAFANVPYRLKTYSEIVANPKDSILFDDQLHNAILNREPQYGADARLVLNNESEVLLTTMADKLLITMLTKLSNFIPTAGIWMNTLRPEWNDANNALVGYGASVVTLCYLQRYTYFLTSLLDEDVQIAEETLTFLKGILNAYDAKSKLEFINLAGKAGEQYRTAAYKGLSGKMVTLSSKELKDFLQKTLDCIHDSIHANKREDGLFNAYNLITFTDDDVLVTPLYEMLEGQVAVLSSLDLTIEQTCDLLDAMCHSALYREDQRSYMLYPNRHLPSFLEKNIIPQEVAKSELVSKLIKKESTVVAQDCYGKVHFNADYHNASYLAAAMQKENLLSPAEQQRMLDIYEQVFNHKAFTGRSGTFYKYEGLGSIYWHMVSKLLLAVGENIRDAINIGYESSYIDRLSQHYSEIREGIGSHKSPQEYGSFPFDAYSHTPSMAGVQQPGMTGQVKEDIISRFNELGIDFGIEKGQPILKFNSWFIDKNDFIDDHLQFTYCNTLIEYCLENGHHGEIVVVNAQKEEISLKGYALTPELTKSILSRDNSILQIIIFI